MLVATVLITHGITTVAKCWLAHTVYGPATLATSHNMFKSAHKPKKGKPCTLPYRQAMAHQGAAGGVGNKRLCDLEI